MRLLRIKIKSEKELPICYILLCTFPFLCDEETKPKLSLMSRKVIVREWHKETGRRRQLYKSANTEANPQNNDSDLIKQNSTHFSFCYRTEKSGTYRITPSVRWGYPNTCSKQSQIQLDHTGPRPLPTPHRLLNTVVQGPCSQRCHQSAHPQPVPH